MKPYYLDDAHENDGVPIQVPPYMFIIHGYEYTSALV